MKSKIKYFLFGPKTSVSMFSYEPYLAFLEKHFERTFNQKKADIVIVSFINDIFENLKDFLGILKSLNVKIFLLSEEPLWDALSKEYISNPKSNKVEINFTGLNFKLNSINYMNSNVFDFNEIPYFITTNRKYIFNYWDSLKPLRQMNDNQIFSAWSQKKYNFCAIGRNLSSDPRFEFCENDEIPILSKKRSILSEEIGEVLGDSFIFGEGWEYINKTRRKIHAKDLDSSIYASKESCLWHHQKLIFAKKHSKFLMSAENTICKNYVTEKFFDGPTSFSIPIFFSNKNEKAYNRIRGVNLSGFNRANCTIEDYILESVDCKDTLLHNLNYAKKVFSENIFEKVNREINSRCKNLTNSIIKKI
jgi:hypothetical protein